MSSSPNYVCCLFLKGWASLAGQTELPSKPWGLEEGMQAGAPQTHPPSRIKVAFGQGLVIVGIGVREGPLSHGAGSEPAEQGKERAPRERGAWARLRGRRPGPGPHSRAGPCAPARSRRPEGTLAPRRPGRQGGAPPRKGCQGPGPTTMQGTCLAPHVPTTTM